MANFIHYFAYYTSWITLPCLAVISIVFHLKNRTKSSLTFSSGIIIMAIGQLIQLFSPIRKMTIDEAGRMLSSSGPPASWYIGSLIFFLGLIITVVGFALVTFNFRGKQK